MSYESNKNAHLQRHLAESFYMTQWAWQGVKLTRLMSIFTSKKFGNFWWKFSWQNLIEKGQGDKSITPHANYDDDVNVMLLLEISSRSWNENIWIFAYHVREVAKRLTIKHLIGLSKAALLVFSLEWILMDPYYFNYIFRKHP